MLNQTELSSKFAKDTFAFQGEVQSMTFPITTVLQYGDFADCKEARDAYVSVTTGIVMPNKQIIT